MRLSTLRELSHIDFVGFDEILSVLSNCIETRQKTFSTAVFSVLFQHSPQTSPQNWWKNLRFVDFYGVFLTITVACFPFPQPVENSCGKVENSVFWEKFLKFVQNAEFAFFRKKGLTSIFQMPSSDADALSEVLAKFPF